MTKRERQLIGYIKDPERYWFDGFGQTVWVRDGKDKNKIIDTTKFSTIQRLKDLIEK